MFDHVTLRVADLAAVTEAFAAALDALEMEQTTHTASLSVWGNFALTQTDVHHPIAHRVDVAFVAPTPAYVERFGRAGIDAGLPTTGPSSRARTTPTIPTRRPSKTARATPSKPSTTTATDPGATSTRSPSA
jgi:hypothetical protein